MLLIILISGNCQISFHNLHMHSRVSISIGRLIYVAPSPIEINTSMSCLAIYPTQIAKFMKLVS